MAWVRLDDLFLEHPKIIGLTDRQLRVHIAGMLYASRHETLGVLNKHALRSIGATPKVQQALIAARVWKRATGNEEEIVIHEFVSYNGRDQETRVQAYLSSHPEATANEVARVVGGNRQQVLKLVEQAKQAGSAEPPPPGSTEPDADRFQGTTAAGSFGGSFSVPVPTPAPGTSNVLSIHQPTNEASYDDPGPDTDPHDPGPAEPNNGTADWLMDIKLLKDIPA